MGKNGNQQVRIHFLNPVSQEDLFTIAGKCDIGLALETGKDENNGIALSNKIFTYLSGGNAILFSDTKAQKRFYEENKGVGIMYESGNVGELKNILLTLSSNLSMIDEMKRSAIKLADETYHWEKEAEKLLTTIHRLE
jgi:glycosyltransferase involved in cell wall biosynthesis